MRQSVRAIVIKDNHMLVMRRNKFGYEYCALVGGAIDVGETREAALQREVAEETTLVISNPRLVIEENAGSMYGMQYIYWCDYVSGEPQLASTAIESKIDAMGRNLYKPMWLPFDQFKQVNFEPKELHATLLNFLANGFPQAPIKLTIRY